jgi:hypothetical protein
MFLVCVVESYNIRTHGLVESGTTPVKRQCFWVLHHHAKGTPFQFAVGDSSGKQQRVLDPALSPLFVTPAS